MTKKTNKEGYDDPTAYEAISSIVRQERAHKRKREKLVFICSPLAGNLKWNIRNARAYSLYAIEQGVVPVTPHLMYTQYLNDNNPAHREMGTQCGLALLLKCREIWVFGGRVSQGMRREIDAARRQGMRIRYFDGGCREVQPFG